MKNIMKNRFARHLLLSTIVIFSSFSFSQQHTDTQAIQEKKTLTGRIYITGEIVEAPCGVSWQNNGIQSECLEQKNNKYNTKINNVTLSNINNLLPRHMGTADLIWLDKKQKIGIINITYQ